jgi:hypothetical protein
MAILLPGLELGKQIKRPTQKIQYSANHHSKPAPATLSNSAKAGAADRNPAQQFHDAFHGGQVGAGGGVAVDYRNICTERFCKHWASPICPSWKAEKMRW